MRLDRAEKVGLALAVPVAVAVGLVMAFSDQAAGLLLALGAAQVFGLFVIRRWIGVRDRLFVHGFHAGWHAATLDECTYPLPCAVLSIAARRRKV